MEIGEHHTHDYWFWHRGANGNVCIRVTAPDGSTLTHVLSASEWASVVAHVSARGESHETWQAAKAMHG